MFSPLNMVERVVSDVLRLVVPLKSDRSLVVSLQWVECELRST